jgi:hypothetical protein
MKKSILKKMSIMSALSFMLLAGCTIKVDSIQQAVIRACEGATWTGATAADTLGLGMTAELTQSYGTSGTATAEKDGTIQAYVNFAATTKNAEGKITCVVIDSIQADSTWNTAGKITTDMTKEPVTKYNKKYDYNMKGSSAIGKEWFEQIDVFKQFITGMTADQVTAIVVGADGKPTDTTLTTGCTMKVTAYKTAVTKALAN